MMRHRTEESEDADAGREGICRQCKDTKHADDEKLWME